MLLKGGPTEGAASTELLPLIILLGSLCALPTSRAPLPAAAAAASYFLCAHLPRRDTGGQSFDTAHALSFASLLLPRLQLTLRTEPLLGDSRTCYDNLESNRQTRPPVMLFTLSPSGPAHQPADRSLRWDERARPPRLQDS